MDVNVITFDETCPYCEQTIVNTMAYFTRSLNARFNCPFCAQLIDGWINPFISLEKSYKPARRGVVQVKNVMVNLLP